MKIRYTVFFALLLIFALMLTACAPSECICGVCLLNGQDKLTLRSLGEITKRSDTEEYFTVDSVYLADSVLGEKRDGTKFIVAVGRIYALSLAVNAEDASLCIGVGNGSLSLCADASLTNRLSDADLRLDGQARWLSGEMSLVFPIKEGELYRLTEEGTIDISCGIMLEDEVTYRLGTQELLRVQNVGNGMEKELTMCDYATGSNEWSKDDPYLFSIWV